MRTQNPYDEGIYQIPEQPQPLSKLVTEKLRTPKAAVIAVVIVVAIVAVLFTITRSQSLAFASTAVSTEKQPDAAGSENAEQGVLVSGGEVFVHVVGAVKQPGVLELPADSRVIDAIEAAGGAAADADLGAINLARPINDGEQLKVPTVAEVAAGFASATGSAAGTPNGSALINLNAASAQELESLPGVGPALAGRIVDWRAANGRFTSVDDLVSVTGIGDKLLESVRSLVTV